MAGSYGASNYADDVSSKEALQAWVVEALSELGGAGTPTQVARTIWRNRESDLRRAGDLFFTWQYDMRWAAQKLRDKGALRSVDGDRRSLWELRGYQVNLVAQIAADSADPSTKIVDYQASAYIDERDRLTPTELALQIVEFSQDLPLGTIFPRLPSQLPISVVASDTRIRNALDREGYKEFSGLAPLRVADLFRMRNVGRSSVHRFLSDLESANRFASGANANLYSDPVAPSKTEAAVQPWLDQLTTDLAVLAQWRSLLGQPNSALLNESAAPEEPPSVVSARDRLNSLTAASVLGADRQTAAEVIDDFLVTFDERSISVLRYRVFADKPETLDILGERFGVTRERMRQLETKAQNSLRDHLAESLTGGLLEAVRTRVEGVSTLEALLREMPSLRVSVGQLDQPVWRVLDRLDQSYEIARGWCAAPSLSEGVEATRRVLAGLDNSSLPTLEEVGAALPHVKLPVERLAEWLFECGFATWSSHVLVRGDGIRERARAILQTAGEPLPASTIHAQLGIDRSLGAVKNALSENAPDIFARVDRGEVYGLSAWGLDHYTSIRTLIQMELSKGDGQVALASLVETITSRFSVAASSIVAYASSYPFRLSDGTVTLATDKTLTERSPWGTRRLYRGEKEWLLRVEISQDHARGAGSLIPTTLASALGLVHGQVAQLNSRLGPQTVSAKGLQPSLGSIRKFCETDSLEIAQSVMLSFADNGTFDVRSIDAAADTIADAALALIGQKAFDAHTSPLEKLAAAVGTSLNNGIAAVIKAYRDRGDDDVAELLELM